MDRRPQSIRILTVDDEVRNRRLLAAMLEADGYSVLEASDGPQALRLAVTEKPDIILLDVMMPDMDGYEVARELKARESTQGIPIIMVTALDDRESRLRGLQAGAEEFITKPVDRNELRVRLRNFARLKEFSDALARARDEAQAADRAKSVFLATMSHEIRTPMNGVLGMAEVLLHQPLPERQLAMVRTIQDSANALLGLIDDILDYSKIEAGRIELEQAPVALGDLIETICASLLPVAAQRGVDLTLFVSPEIPQLVIGDELRLRQVIYNLLGNALKFSAGRPEQRGKVALRAEVACREPLQVSLRVVDNGIGMTLEVMANLFTPFKQGEASTTRRYGGTGLGLTICQRLVALMRGDIAVTSTPGSGSTFALTIPFATAVEQPISDILELAGLSCVLLESPDLDADDLAVYLEHAGAQVCIVPDADAAAEAVERLPDPVVVIENAERARALAPAHTAAFAASLNVGRVLVTHGRRRRCRVQADNVVTLDRDALRRRSLLRAVVVAAGRAEADETSHPTKEVMIGDTGTNLITVSEARSQGRLILVAEDDTTNQNVILQQLALLGYRGEVAENGEEALRLWREGGYALLLTDLHMPERDGYDLARAIRREEGERSRMPILALTANALRCEAARARAAGMDDYLTKPVRLEALRHALQSALSTVDAVTEAREPVIDAEHQGEDRILDVSVLEGLVGNDPDVVADFLADFLRLARRQVAELCAAARCGESASVGAIAHKLKSSSRSVGASAFGDLCAELDDAGKTGASARIAELLPQFETQFDALEERVSRTILLHG